MSNLILPSWSRMKPPLGSRRDVYHSLSRGLVGYWLMNEGAGTRVNDLSGNCNHGTIAGATWVAGPWGPSLYFDAAADYLNVGDLKNAVEGVTGLSVCAWVKAGLSDNDSSRDIVAKYGSGNDTFSLSWASNENIIFTVKSSSATGSSTYTDGIPVGHPDIWYYIVGVYDGAQVSVFVNAVAATPGTLTGETLTSTLPVAIGSNSDLNNEFWNGHIDNVAIYNRALTPAEICQLYREPWAGIEWPGSDLTPWVAILGAGGNAYSETINDGLGLSDAASRVCQYGRTLTESMGTTDALGNASVAVRAFVESLGLTDNLSKAEAKALSDSVGIVDAIIQVWEVNRTFAETLGQTDALGKTEAKVLADSLGLTDVPVTVAVVLRTLADSLGLTDAFGKAEGKTVADGVGLTDNMASLWQAVRSVADSLGLTDVMSEIFEGSGVFVRTVNDALGLTDAVNPIQVLLRVMSDNLSLADAVASVFVASRIVSDSVGITDGVFLGRMMAVADTVGIRDDLARIVAYLRTATDTEGLLDSMARVIQATRTFDDSVGMTDQMQSQFGALFKAAWAFLLLKRRR